MDIIIFNTKVHKKSIQRAKLDIILCNFYLFLHTKIMLMNTEKKYIPPKSVIDTDKEFMLRLGCKLKRMRLDKKLSISKVNHDLLITRKTILFAEEAKSYVSLNIILRLIEYYQSTPYDFFSNFDNEIINDAEL